MYPFKIRSHFLPHKETPDEGAESSRFFFIFFVNFENEFATPPYGQDYLITSSANEYYHL